MADKKYIRITILLRPEQEEGLNGWRCTINGQSRLMSHCKVIIHALTLEEAIKSFDEKEVLEYVITNTF